MVLLVRDLYQRDKRNEIFEENFWTLFAKSEVKNDIRPLLKRINIDTLEYTPFMVDIQDRFKVFKFIILQGSNHQGFPGFPTNTIRINPQNVLQSALSQIHPLGNNFAQYCEFSILKDDGSVDNTYNSE